MRNCMKYMLLFVGLFISLFLFTACQRTPKQEVIVGRRNESYTQNRDLTEAEKMPSNVEANASNKENETKPKTDGLSKLECPEHIAEEITEYKNITVTVDADIVNPEVEA